MMMMLKRWTIEDFHGFPDLGNLSVKEEIPGVDREVVIMWLEDLTTLRSELSRLRDIEMMYGPVAGKPTGIFSGAKK